MDEIICPTCHDGFNSVEEYTQHVLSMQKKPSKEFETPLMRDISSMFIRVIIGLVIGFGIFLFCFFPFNDMTVYGSNCMETSSYSIGEWIIRSLTIHC